jgi:antitoxin (DNA-binding transcriptional repressor) of toxin-antitoxin stability system
MAIIKGVDVRIAEAKNRLPELIRSVENGEEVVIAGHGNPLPRCLLLTQAAASHAGRHERRNMRTTYNQAARPNVERPAALCDRVFAAAMTFLTPAI